MRIVIVLKIDRDVVGIVKEVDILSFMYEVWIRKVVCI